VTHRAVIDDGFSLFQFIFLIFLNSDCNYFLCFQLISDDVDVTYLLFVFRMCLSEFKPGQRYLRCVYLT